MICPMFFVADRFSDGTIGNRIGGFVELYCTELLRGNRNQGNMSTRLN